MTLAELQAAGRRANEIEIAIRNYREAMRTLSQVNKYVESGQFWRPQLRLDDGKQSWNGPVTIEIVIPAGIIQQQAVYAVDAARRRIIALGGEVPA